MQGLLEGIQTQFKNSADLVDRFGSLYFGLGPDGYDLTAKPLIRFNVMPSKPDYNTGSTYEHIYEVQFDIFYSASATADSDLVDAMKDFNTAFNNSRLTITIDASKCNYCRMISQYVIREDEKIWHGILNYQISISEDL